jgi:hypothetical protein
MKPDDDERCRTCRYAYSIDLTSAHAVPLDAVHCRRYPPTLYAHSASNWPQVTLQDWCGEWRPWRAEQPAPERVPVEPST